MKVLAITSGEDPHVDMVQRYIEQPIIRFDPSLFPKTSISFLWNNGAFEVFSDGRSFSDVDVVWYRKPVLLKPNEIPVAASYQDFAHDSYRNTVRALYGILQDKFWVSDPWAIFKGGNKLHQLELAHRLNFKVPRTLVTSSPQQAKQFIDNVGHVVTKAMTAEAVWINEMPYLVYTTHVPRDVDFSGLSISPAIFQEEIEKDFDIRVTVIGTQAFSCEIHQTGSIHDEIDWRKGTTGNELVYKPCEFPMSETCIRMVAIMGLQYGAIEFVMDKKGDYWFMEINPNGQWGFIELETGLPLSQAMANLFGEKSKHKST